MSENITSAKYVGDNYTPPTSWSKLTADEKIERLREIIKQEQRSHSYTRNQLYRLQRVFGRHTHDMNNRITTPYDEYESFGWGEAASPKKDMADTEVYF